MLSLSQAEKLKLKPPRFKSVGTDDTSFLANVHQSTFYKVKRESPSCSLILRPHPCFQHATLINWVWSGDEATLPACLSSPNTTSLTSVAYIIQIVGLEHELKVEGKLRTLSDLKDFWNHMLTPPSKPPSTRPASHHRPPSTPFTFREDEDEEYSDSWAITAIPPQRSNSSPRRVSLLSHIIIIMSAAVL